jgi:outer membrane protein
VNRQSVLAPFLAITLAAAIAGAQTAPPQTKVGIINMQGALIGTKDGQKAAKELEARRAPKTKELEGRQGEINQLKDQLNKGSNTLSEDARKKLMMDIDGKTKAFNRDLEDIQAEWDQEQNKIIQELGQRVMVVIDKYARDNGYAIVIDISNQQTPVLYAANSVDITQDIIRLYDANAPATPMGSGTPTSAVKPGLTPARPAPVPSPVRRTPSPVK